MKKSENTAPCVFTLFLTFCGTVKYDAGLYMTPSSYA